MNQRPPLIPLIAGAVALLGIASTATLTVAFDAPAAPSSCPAPPLSGSVVDVTLADMGPMMGPMMGPGMMGMSMMRVLVAPAAVPAGQVSLRVRNSGSLTHEVIVMPLGANQVPGQRSVGAGAEVDEAGSLGEASRSCGADAGEGIVPGATAWTTLTLPPGRYELLCNISGHYGAGMYAELDAVNR